MIGAGSESVDRPDVVAASERRAYVKAFLAIALPIGLLYVFLSPAFQVPDEHTHFFRIYHLSEGGFIAQKIGDATGAALPRSLPTLTFIYTLGIHEQNQGKISSGIFHATRAIPLLPDDTTFVAFNNTALYSPVPYIPQVAAVFVLRLLDAPPLWMLYLARLANFLTAIFLLAAAIWLLPFLRPLFALAVLTPTSMYQLASLSADGLTIALSLLFTALVLNVAYGNVREISGRVLAGLLLLSVGVCLAKSAYFLIPLLVFLIPRRKFGGRNPLLVKFAVVLSGFTALAVWALLVRDIYSPTYSFEHIDPDAARTFILESPLRFLWILVSSVAKDAWSYMETFIGIQDWDLLVLPRWFVAVYVVGLFTSALGLERNPQTVRWQDKSLVAAIAWVSVGIIATAVYVTWSRPGSNYILGMQGRYLVSLMPLLLFPLYGSVKHFSIPALLLRVVTFLLAGAALLTALALNSIKFYMQ